MAADNKASYARIGAAVFFGALAIAGTLVYLGGVGDHGHEMLAETYAAGEVSGLAVGSVVNFRGVKVGEVKKISFVGCEYEFDNPEDGGKVYILMKFDTRLYKRLNERSTPEELLMSHIRRGVHATVSSSGITGLSRIELNFPTSPVAKEEISWAPRYPLIPPAPSMLESFSKSATRIMNQINKMDFVSVWSNISSVAESSAKIVESVDGLVESQRAGISEAVKHIGSAAAEVSELAERLKENPSLLLRESDADPLPETSR